MNVVELREFEEEINGVLANFGMPPLQEYQLEILVLLLRQAPHAWE